MSYMEGVPLANEVAERYRALVEEYRVYEDRLQKALAHRSAFSEKVLAKVTSEYRAKMEQLAEEQSNIEGHLRAELATMERQLQAMLPNRARFQEETEELELRYITGEISEKEYLKRKAALEAQKPASGSHLDTLQQKVQFYRQILGLEEFHPGVEVHEPDDRSPQTENEDSEHHSNSQDATLLEAPIYTHEAPSVELVEEAEEYTYVPTSYPQAGQEEQMIDEAIESSLPAEEQYSEEPFEDVSTETPPASPALQEEEEEALFRNHFDDPDARAGTPPRGQPPAYYESTSEEEFAEEALEPQEETELSGAEIPEDLLLDEEDDPLEPGEDARELQPAEELLQEDYEDALLDQDTPGVKALEPVVIIREGMPDERIYYMTSNLLTIGRGPDNDIQLATDTSVSRHHSKITYEDDEYWIADLGSSNGTIVNGARVSKTVLSGEDEVSIGQTLLKFKFI